jgi:queuine tRNA-ribosyltransferase
MRTMHRNIVEDTFPEFIQDFFDKLFPNGDFPSWAVDALASVNVHLKKS